MSAARILLLALLCSTIACKKDRFDIQNLNGGRILALGHGGMGIYSTWPLNSASSLLAAVQRGADGVEVDVQLTLDDVLVAFHDGDLSISTDRSGVVADLLSTQVQEARYAQPTYTEHRIVQLDHLFNHADLPSDRMYSFDVKLFAGAQDYLSLRTRMADALAELLLRHELVDRAFIECPDPDFLLAFRQRVPDAQLMLSRTSFEEAVDLAVQYDLKGVVHNSEEISRSQVQAAHDHGRWVCLLAKARSEQRTTVEKNPEIILSDRIDHLVDLLD